MPRSLVVLLTLLVALGHACELPISAAALPHVHAAAHDAAHAHPEEGVERACDAISAIPPSASAALQGDHGRQAAAGPARADVLAPGEFPVPALAEPGRSSGRPPLFLLHRSLLI